MSLHTFIERVRAYGIRPENRRKITAHQMYPWSIERQFQQDLLAQFRNAGTFYEQQALKNTWSFNDTVDDLTRSEYDNDMELSSIARRVSYDVEYFQQQCFENFTETVIGARYIPTVVAPTITDTWQKNFMTLCRSTNDEMKKKVSAIVSDAVMNGNNIADTRKQIQEAVSTFSKSKANLIARTETAKLNMAISKAQMEEAGVEYYEWACMLDERTRQSHAKMDGKICIWNNPNVVYDLKTHRTKPRPQSAVHLHPGDDYNCRCIALPWDPLIEEELNQKKGKPNKQWLELKEQEKQKAAEKRAEREEIKRNKELVPKLEKQVESMKTKTDKLQQELLEEQLEREGLEETLLKNSDVSEFSEQVIHIHSDKGVTKITITATSRQEAKYLAYLDIKNNPEKYGPNAIVPKFDAKKYEQQNGVTEKTAAKNVEKTKSTTEKPTNKDIPNDIKELARKIRNGTIDEQWLNENIFDGYRVLSDTSFLTGLSDDVLYQTLMEMKANPKKFMTSKNTAVSTKTITKQSVNKEKTDPIVTTKTKTPKKKEPAIENKEPKAAPKSTNYDVYDLSKKIAADEISVDELNDQLFGGEKVLKTTTVLKRLPDNVRTNILYEMKNGKFDVQKVDITGFNPADNLVRFTPSDIKDNLSTYTAVHEWTHSFDYNKGITNELGFKIYRSVDKNFGKKLYDEFVSGLIDGTNSSMDIGQKLDKILNKALPEPNEENKSYRMRTKAKVMSAVRDWVGLSGRPDLMKGHDESYPIKMEKFMLNRTYNKSKAKFAALSLESLAEVSEILGTMYGKDVLKAIAPDSLKLYYSIFED